MTHRVMGVNGEAPACQPPTRSPSPHRVRMAVAEVQMRAAGGPCARRGMLDAGARSRHDVVGTHRSKERLSAAAQRCRAGLVVVSLEDVSHGSGKILLPPYGKYWTIALLGPQVGAGSALGV